MIDFEDELYEKWCLDHYDKAFDEVCRNCHKPVHWYGDGFNEPREQSCGRDMSFCEYIENWCQENYNEAEAKANYCNEDEGL